MLKNSARNWALYRSLNAKFLNIEKSTFLKPLSRSVFRPMVPYVPALGGTMTDLPLGDTKQPPWASVSGSGASALHLSASDEGYVVERPEIPDTDVQVTGPGKPEHQGRELEPLLKSLGFP